MLAKELKIKAMMKQRKFIEEQLKNSAEMNNGNVFYAYKGALFIENKNHFINEGFDVRVVTSDLLSALNDGACIYTFSVSDTISLSSTEKEESEKIATRKNHA